MCNSRGCRGKGGCTKSMYGRYLLIAGGLNWGLIGLGILLGGGSWNVLNMLLGSVPTLEAIVYLLIGLVAVMEIFGGCRCSKCTSCAPTSSEAEETTEVKM